MANKNHAGAVVHRYRRQQERIDDRLDREGVPGQIRLPKPVRCLADGARVWEFLPRQ